MSHGRMLASAGGLYALLALAGASWIALRDGLAGWVPAGAVAIGIGLAWGTAGGLAVVLGWHGMCTLSGRLQEFEESLARFFHGLPLAGCAWLAMTSAVGEELLFRGGLQSSVGLWAASLIFGLVHVPPRKEMAPWPVFAGVVGLLLGWIYVYTGTLAGPIAGHFTINFVNLARMARAGKPMNAGAEGGTDAGEDGGATA